MLKQFSTPAKLASLSLCVSQIIACGGTGQDDGKMSTFQQEFRGRAIDGYLARATVFVDTNNDGTRNPWEAFAFTDNEGFYSYNPNTETNYCAADATPQQAQYCLRVDVERSDVVIRIDSGYDVLTGEPFTGQLSRRIDASQTEEVVDTLISPISTLLTNVNNESDRTALLSTLDLSSEDLDVDYLNSDGNGSINGELLATALKIHKTVTVLSDRITDTYTLIGDEVNTPNDASATVYSTLAEQMLASNATSFNETINDSSALNNVMQTAQQQMQNIYENREFDLPTPMDDNSLTRVINVTQGLNAIVDSLTTSETMDSMDNARGVSRAVESVVIKALNEEGSDSTIDNAVTFFTAEDNTLAMTLVEAMSRDGADITSLVNNSFNAADLDSEEKILAATQLPAGASPFSGLGGKQLGIADLDLGSAPNDLKDSEVELYFNGDANDISGSFTACVKHIDGANIDGTLGEGNTRGELVDGFWSLLGYQEGRGAYSLLITITFLGTTYQAIMKPAGYETVDGSEYQRIRFDNDGDIGVWHSLEGLQDIETLPTTNAACEQNLPSRVGI